MAIRSGSGNRRAARGGRGPALLGLRLLLGRLLVRRRAGRDARVVEEDLLALLQALEDLDVALVRHPRLHLALGRRAIGGERIAPLLAALEEGALERHVDRVLA